MKKVIRLTESDLERIIKKVINEQSKDEITYSVQKGQNGKFRIFVTTPKYKSPVDASKAFGQGDMWKDYNTQDDAQKVINSITGNNTMKLGGPKHKMSPKHLTMESELERIIGKVINEQSTKFFEEVRNVNWTKRISKPEDVVSDSEPYKMPEYFKPYIGLTVSEPDFTAKIDDIAFGGAKPILKIKSLNPAYQEKDQEYDPEKYGFEGVMAEIKIGNSDSQAGFYYDCAGKQWKLWYNDKFRDKKIFNKKFFELGDFIQSKFCNSYITKPRREHI